MQFVATTTLGAEGVLAEELAELGIEGPIPDRGAVRFEGGIELGYRACLWSRIASRVLLVLGSVDARDADELYDGVRAIRWSDHLAPTGSLAVDFVGTSPAVRNSKFGAMRVKDAVVDALRGSDGNRPSVDLATPDLRIQCRLVNNRAAVSVDLTGSPLFLRGLNRDGGPAPLKETLAAAILRLADWPAVAASGGGLVDPMCGCGTFLVEAAGMAAGVAPGLGRERWGFDGWRGHDSAAWKSERAAAEQAPRRALPPMLGSDLDSSQVRRARANLARAGFAEVPLAVAPMEESGPVGELPGVVVTNPPYGERLHEEDLVGVYRALGDVLRRRYLGWTGWVLAGSPALARQTGLKPKQKIPLWNGRIECRLIELPISDRAPQRME